MFNNLINTNDLIVFYRKLKKQRTFVALGKLFSSKSRRVELAWKHTNSISSNWWDIPAITERWNTLITGSPEVSYQQYVCKRYFTSERPIIGVSLGCGAGNKEIEWVKRCSNLHLAGIDISENRIRQAIVNSTAHNLNDRLSFRTGSVYELAYDDQSLDCIIVDGALHHFHDLDVLLPKIRRWMKSDGLFIVNEYVGPARFQWTEKQLYVINELLEKMPERFRRDSDGYRKTKVHRPGRLSMILSDPSEAVESDRIEPLLHQYFSVVERKPYGGMILQNLLKGIAHHFTKGDSEADELLNQWCTLEDDYLRTGELPSDFIFFICRTG
jgi:ubiquinone/menaquinone biosynthesis C-methylase UbiE